MKTSFITLLSLLLGSLLLSSCESCGDPNITHVTEEDAAWLVYDSPTDTIRFVDETANEILYTRIAVVAGNVPGAGSSFEDDCIENLDTQVRVNLQDVKIKRPNQAASPGLATYILKKPNDLTVNLIVENIGTYELDETKPTITEEVNGKTYSNVYELSPAATKPTDVTRILFSKEHGFISIAFNNGKMLELKPKTEKPAK